MIFRSDNRAPEQMRPVNITPDFISSAEGSALIEAGNTRVICTASVEETVPAFLRNSGKGWISSEYGMLPRVRVARGSIPYSLEIHPLPELRRNAGTVSSTEAVQITRVLPASISAEPSADEMKSGVMLTGRICSGARLSLRKIIASDSK